MTTSIDLAARLIDDPLPESPKPSPWLVAPVALAIAMVACAFYHQPEMTGFLVLVLCRLAWTP